MNIIELNVNEIIPYENNPRNNDEAVSYVANSIREFGFKVPIVIDKNNIIIAGHTRLKASKVLGLEKVPCIIADDLSEEQIKAFRLADNKVGEIAEWDLKALDEELQGILNINMDDFGFGDIEDIPGTITDFNDETYTTKINIPQYEITGAKPLISELVDDSKSLELMEKIENAQNITEEEREFLKLATFRHNAFHYANIAEYYAHATPEMQELMEESALVIIDYDDAIKNGYVRLSKGLEILNDSEEC